VQGRRLFRCYGARVYHARIGRRQTCHSSSSALQAFEQHALDVRRAVNLVGVVQRSFTARAKSVDSAEEGHRPASSARRETGQAAAGALVRCVECQATKPCLGYPAGVPGDECPSVRSRVCASRQTPQKQTHSLDRQPTASCCARSSDPIRRAAGASLIGITERNLMKRAIRTKPCRCELLERRSTCRPGCQPMAFAADSTEATQTVKKDTS